MLAMHKNINNSKLQVLQRQTKPYPAYSLKKKIPTMPSTNDFNL